MIDAIVGFAGSVLLVVGLLLASIGLYGMLRRPSIFEQLHAAGLVTGPGVILVLAAALASASFGIATSAVLVIMFVLVTASLSTHVIALASWRSWGEEGPARLGRRTAAGDARRREGEEPPSTGMRVLLAHDGSPGADVAVALVASLPWGAGSVIRVVGATDGDLEPFSEPTDGPGPRLVDQLERAATALARPGITVDHVVRHGDPSGAIAAEAERFAADLVVIGSRGLGPVRTLLLGSVAAATVDAAPCSVLVARVPRLGKAVLGADGSPAGAVAIAAVKDWPIFDGVPIAVLSVATTAPAYGSRTNVGGLSATIAKAEQQRLADAVAGELIEAGRQATAHAGSGDAAAQVVGFAASASAELIVLGTRQRTGLRRTLLGSVGRVVVSSTVASVLIVKAPPR